MSEGRSGCCPSERKLKNVDRYVTRQSKKIAERTCAGQFENEDIFVNLIDEKPIGRDVTFTMIRPVAGECMVSVGRRQFLAMLKEPFFAVKISELYANVA